jgi:hypothetical protein
MTQHNHREDMATALTRTPTQQVAVKAALAALLEVTPKEPETHPGHPGHPGPKRTPPIMTVR